MSSRTMRIDILDKGTSLHITKTVNDKITGEFESGNIQQLVDFVEGNHHQLPGTELEDVIPFLKDVRFFVSYELQKDALIVTTKTYIFTVTCAYDNFLLDVSAVNGRTGRDETGKTVRYIFPGQVALVMSGKSPWNF